jgi:hypothetical protein
VHAALAGRLREVEASQELSATTYYTMENKK